MDLEIRDPVFFSVRHRGPDVAKYQRKLKNSNFPHVFMGRRPGINNFLRRASEHGRYFIFLKYGGTIAPTGASFIENIPFFAEKRDVLGVPKKYLIIPESIFLCYNANAKSLCIST